MTDEENNRLSAEIDVVKEKVLFLIAKPYSISNKKEISGLLNTITALTYRWGLRKGYRQGWAKAKEGTTCRSCVEYSNCWATEEGKCDEYKKKERRKQQKRNLEGKDNGK